MLLRQTTFAAIAALMCLFVANDAMAQRGGWGGGSGRLEYLRNEGVQKELDLVDEQVEDLKDVGDEARDVMRNAFSGMREKFADMSREERGEFMTEARAKIQEDLKEVEKKVGDVLLPHQLERLDQIVLQGQMRRGGTARALNSEAVREKLGLTEEEAEKLQAKEEEVNKKMEEEIQKIRERSRDEIFSVLPADKQEKIKKMLGDAYELQQRGRRGGGGTRGGDRGGRGGNRGGRGGDRGGF